MIRITRVAIVCVLLSALNQNFLFAQDSKEMAPGSEFRDCESCPLMVIIPPGSFMMGLPESVEGRDDERPNHSVTISYDFAVSKFEVTFQEWDACVSEGGCSYHPDDNGWGRGSRPVIHVNWDDANEYVDWLSRKTGWRYRLLSESEWEYVARAGSTGPFHFGSTISPDQANYRGHYTWGGGPRGVYREKTVPVGSFPGNDFGLHDVHGNVWEWVEDCWRSSHHGAPKDGSAWTWDEHCYRRVLRGGSWFDVPWALRSSRRDFLDREFRFSTIGFRVASTLTPLF